MCWPKQQIALVSALFWLGWCVTLLWVPRFADVYGRKWMIAYNNMVSLALYVATLFAPNVYFLGAVLFTWGIFNSIRTSVAFLYMIELMPKNKQNLVGTVWNCFEGSINLFATAYFMYVSLDYFWFVAIGLAFQLFSCSTVWFLPESPIYLLKRGRIDELKDVLKQIAETNGVKINAESFEFEDDKEKKSAGHRRPDKAENVMMLSGLQAGTSEHKFREWLALNLPQELSGLIYHIAMTEDGRACYVSFITHKAMREAKTKLNKLVFKRSMVRSSAEDITRTELVATALNISIQDDEVPPLSFWLSKPDIFSNLVIMAFVWAITVSDFYLISFLVNTYEQIFLCAIASGVSEFIAQAAGGYLYEVVGTQKSLSISYSISAVGGFVMLFYGLDHQSELIFPLLVLVMKFGISGAFNITYNCHKGCFPTLFSTTSLGYCTFICRFFTAFTPVMAQMDKTISTGIFALSSTFGALIVLGLKKISDDDYPWKGRLASLIKKDE